MSEKKWKRLNILASCLVLLLGISLYQKEKQEELQNQMQNLWVRETIATQIPNNIKRKVYLTFDDGPSRYTNELLDILKKENVKATFFVIGHEGKVYEERYKRIVEEGHTLAMHAYEHNYNKIYKSEETFADDLLKLQTMLKKVTGVKPTIYRFPGGSSNSVMKIPVKNFIHILNEQGITYYDWNALSEDAVNKKLSPTQLNANIMKNLKRKDPCIVLMHDLGDRHGTVEALIPLIQKLKKMNCELLPITEATPVIQHVKNSEKE